MKERTLVANLPGDSGWVFMYVTIPLNENLITALKKVQSILELEKKLISTIVIDGSTMKELCDPKEIYQPSFREEAPLEGEYQIVNYALPRGDKAYVSLHISLSTVSITAIDIKNDESFATRVEVSVPLEEIL